MPSASYEQGPAPSSRPMRRKAHPRRHARRPRENGCCRSLRRDMRRIEAAIHSLEQQNGCPPSESDSPPRVGPAAEGLPAHAAGRGVATQLVWRSRGFQPRGRRRPYLDRHSPGVRATIRSPCSRTPTCAVRSGDREHLPEREQLGDGAVLRREELNLREIGAVLGVTESRDVPAAQPYGGSPARLRLRGRHGDAGRAPARAPPPRTGRGPLIGAASAAPDTMDKISPVGLYPRNRRYLVDRVIGGGHLSPLFQPTAFMIVIGGTLARSCCRARCASSCRACAWRAGLRAAAPSIRSSSRSANWGRTARADGGPAEPGEPDRGAVRPLHASGPAAAGRHRAQPPARGASRSRSACGRTR